ncbi:hypothetical protein PUMCH_004173 [Australozyma saopauloensis]|uniref:Glutathione hydrolase n=1 Tax=Australozyma saopauloensis TaxID=291208 RepID=A0AAX4HEZ4_9ASCO|nr:hypothetical protein PUMCH_004173 [[Candida] saopauloensis]
MGLSATKNDFRSKSWVTLLFVSIALVVVIFRGVSQFLYLLTEVTSKCEHNDQLSDFHMKVLKQLQDENILEDPVGNRIGKPTLNPSESLLAKGSKAMVACDVPLCSTMGKNILLKGGNAADAAVTVALCIGSVNLHSSGIGGGGYIVSTNGTDAITIDAREMAPNKAHKNMFVGSPTLSLFGGLAVAVPGELAGLYLLFVNHGLGILTWEDLFQPVIELNREGWPADEIWIFAVHKMHELVLSKSRLLSDQWDFIYKGEKQHLVEEGDIIRRPNYADTLEAISKNGSHAIFYDPDGPFAPRLAAKTVNTGGILDVMDFVNYEPEVSPALAFNFSTGDADYELFTSSGVSSGLALVAGLNFYSTLNNRDAPGENDTDLQQHRLIEAMKWTSSARSHLGDANHTYWNEVKRQYTSPEWANTIIDEKKYSDNTTFDWNHYGPLYEMAGKHGTSHFSVVDENGNGVSMTTTVNLLFGSMVYDNKTGIILNDQMDDFSLPHHSNAFNLTPSILNFIYPRHRPLSLMSPTIIKKDGKIDLLIGAAGGSRIVTAILQAIVRNLFHGLPLLNTIAYSRIHHQLIPAYVMVENNTVYENEFASMNPHIEQNLAKLNHEFFESGALTAMNAIKRANGTWEGVSDFWRKHGKADGY